jgi:hypothetical protein
LLYYSFLAITTEKYIMKKKSILPQSSSMKSQSSKATPTSEEHEVRIWVQYNMKHKAQQTQIRDCAHKKALTFFKNEVGDPNLTQQDFIPVYLGMLGKGARVYCQEKDERNVSFCQYTTSPISSSADEKQHKLLNKNHESKEKALSPLSGLEAAVCERETPFHQDLRMTIAQPQKPGIMFPRQQSHVIGPIKCLNVKTLQTQILEESHNPFTSITSQSLRRSLVKPALVNDQSHASLEWRRRSPSSSVITNVMCKTEAPSRPDISSLATSIRHADSDWG